MAPAALLFDLDGTLVDSAVGIAAALSTIRRNRGGDGVSVQEVRPLVSLGAEILVRRALGPFASDAAEDLADFRAVLGGLAPDREAIFPGVTDALAAFDAAGHAMAVVTNKPEGLARDLLEGLDLVRRFDAIVGGDTAGMAKPHPAPVRRALAQIGAEPDQALFVGDSDVDAAAARSCALRFLLFTGGYGAASCPPHDVHARFGDFGALPALVRRLALRSAGDVGHPAAEAK